MSKRQLRSILLVFTMFLASETFWRTGNGLSSYLNAAPPITANRVGKIEKDLEKFITTKEKYLKSSHERMLEAIERVEKKIKFGKLDPDLKVLALQRVSDDYERCKSSNCLPSCDELLNIAIRYAEERQKVVDAIEKKRKLMLDKSIKTEGDADIVAKLDTMEARLAKLVGERAVPFNGDKWNGHGVSSHGDGFEIKIHITETSGSSFKGELILPYSRNRANIMKFKATRKGTRFILKTTQMVRGKRQYHELHGYLLGRRVVGGMKSKYRKPKVHEARFQLARK